MSGADEWPRPAGEAGHSPCKDDIGQRDRRALLRFAFLGGTRMVAARAGFGSSVPKVSRGLCTLARCGVDTCRYLVVFRIER